MKNKIYLCVIIVCNFFAFSGYGMKNPYLGVSTEEAQRKILEKYNKNIPEKTDQNKTDLTLIKLNKSNNNKTRINEKIAKNLNRSLSRSNEKNNYTQVFVNFLSKVNQKNDGYIVNARTEQFKEFVNNLDKSQYASLDNYTENHNDVLTQIAKELSIKVQKIKKKIEFTIENIKSIYAASNCFKDFLRTLLPQTSYNKQQLQKTINDLIISNETIPENLIFIGKFIKKNVHSFMIEDYTFFLSENPCSQVKDIMMLDKEWINKRSDELKELIKDNFTLGIIKGFVDGNNDKKFILPENDKKIIEHYIKNSLEIDAETINKLTPETIKNILYQKVKPPIDYSPTKLVQSFLKKITQELCEKTKIETLKKIFYSILEDENIKEDNRSESIMLFCLIRYNYHKMEKMNKEKEQDLIFFTEMRDGILEKITTGKFSSLIALVGEEGRKDYNVNSFFSLDFQDFLIKNITKIKNNFIPTNQFLSLNYLLPLKKHINQYQHIYRAISIPFIFIGFYKFYKILQRLYSKTTTPH